MLLFVVWSTFDGSVDGSVDGSEPGRLDGSLAGCFDALKLARRVIINIVLVLMTIHASPVLC